MTRLSKNFTLEELTCSATAFHRGIANDPTDTICYALFYGCQHVLQPARDMLGEPIIITSGYRCPLLNSVVGGVKNSQHQFGEAADIHVAREEYGQRLFAILKTLPAVDQLLFERAKSGGQWLHVSWRFQNPRHYFNYNYHP